MSITINGATNTITAASGLTIAGNTAVTGTLSATGAITSNDGTVAMRAVGFVDTGYVGTTSNHPVVVQVNNATAGTFSSTGLAVTGTLGATGKISTSSSAGGRVISAENDTNTNQTQMQINNTNGRCEIGVLTSGHAYAGSITAGASLHLYGGNVDLALVTATALTPTVDNTYNFGSASLGWKEIFADNGTINTSDARRKTEVSALSAAEINAAKQLAKEIGSFKFLAAIAEKGEYARKHIGMTVQRAIEIMEANGLNPFAYSFICHDAWDDVFVEHPATETEAAWTEQTQVAGDKYSFRVHELLLFMAAGFEARLSALEA